MNLDKIILEVEAVLSKTAASIQNSTRPDTPGVDRLTAYARLANTYSRLALLKRPSSRSSEPTDDLLAGMTEEERDAYCAKFGDPNYVDSLYKEALEG